MIEKQTQNEDVDSLFALDTKDSDEEGSEKENISDQVLSEFVSEVDPRLLNAGWGFLSAKSVEYGKVDQPLANHIRNAVFVLARLNEIATEFGGYQLDETELREVVALTVIHDVHKLAESEGAADEFELDVAFVDTLAEKLQLTSFAPTLSTADEGNHSDFYACAVDHHNDCNAKPEMSTRQFDHHRSMVRLADALASCETPEQAASRRRREALWDAYPGCQELTLHAHTIDDVKGVFTNLLNNAVNDVLREEFGYRLLAIYQDGCVYLAEEDLDSDAKATPTINEEFIGSVYKSLKNSIQDSHEAYANFKSLAGNLTTQSQGFYAINNQDFFYAGTETVLAAVVAKSFQDADPAQEPTDNMRETMEMLSEQLPIDIRSEDRVAAGYARLAYTVKRAFVDPVVKGSDVEGNALVATCRLFDLPEDVIEGLAELQNDSDINLTAGGKWDYGYAIGQRIAERERQENLRVPDVVKWIMDGLSELHKDWSDLVMTEHTGELQQELRTYIGEVVRIEGELSTVQEKTSLTDPFNQHHTKRRGKTCTFCNRGTTSTRKSDMEARKSLTTFQAGYSNRIPADATKPDNLLACIPCQIEFSLRETGTGRRNPDDDRLFIHLIPDYFYTPHMWELYADEILLRFTGEAMTRIGRLASAVFRLAYAHEEVDEDYISTTDPDWPESAEDFAEILREATTDEGGRSMIESVSQGFKTDAQFGAQTLSYFKQQDNETEFQFFGVFVGLSVATAAGLRVYISQSPLPDLRGRDFPQMAKLDAGFTSVAEFYGSDIPLSQLRDRLGAAAALIQLGYEVKRDDARFAKYLRVTRNKHLPGSYLLKRAAQDSDDGNTAKFLLEEAKFLDERTGTTDTTPARTERNLNI
jgi:CRISPR-associated protein Csc3